MDKQFAKYMKYGKTVKSRLTGESFKLLENMTEEKDTVKVVNLNNRKRYELLNAWIRNWEQNIGGFRERFTGDIQECRSERQSYEEEVKVADVVPGDKIRFVTPGGETLFEAEDLSNISLDGRVQRVIYLDSCHFQFWGGFCYHIFEFAELCKRNGVIVKPA